MLGVPGRRLRGRLRPFLAHLTDSRGAPGLGESGDWAGPVPHSGGRAV